MFYTIYNPAPLRLEKSSSKTLVTEVPVMGNSERIAQSLISGALINADRLGFDFQADEKLPERFNTFNLRGADITEKLEFLEYINGAVSEHMKKKNEADAVALEEQKKQAVLEEQAKYDAAVKRAELARKKKVDSTINVD